MFEWPILFFHRSEVVNRRCSAKYSEIFKNIYFYERPPVASSYRCDPSFIATANSSGMLEQQMFLSPNLTFLRKYSGIYDRPIKNTFFKPYIAIHEYMCPKL